MKKYFDSFYEIIHKNSVKRRRMVSLLLVLSVFVSSGVLWELRDTVITMVNEPLCGFEEHNHTDECYEKVLICGAEESEEHTHTDECYEKVLICGHEEHNHIPLCYTDDVEEASEAFKLSEEAESDLLSIEVPEEELQSAEFDAEAMTSFQFGDQSMTSLAGETLDPSKPELLPDTIDNISKGIKFTLFDFNDEDRILEGEPNNYGIRWKEDSNSPDHGYWEHPYVKEIGINSEKNPAQDIMFFAYGTPAFTGTLRDDDDPNNPQNVYTRVDPDKNNYSGDYNTFGTTYPSPMSGNRPVQGIVNRKLENGFPVVSGSGHSLDYLFKTDVSESEKAYKTVYPDVNHLLRENDVKHLYFNSDDNYAYFDQDTSDFKVYDRTFEIVNDNHHYGTDIDPKTGETYNSAITTDTDNEKRGDVDPGFKIGFFPFDDYNYSKKDPNYNTVNATYNHHFGMTMEAQFKNVLVGNDPVVFKYSGDDDMWIFVDDVLVLDIGGIHEPAGGMIDFTNGIVWVQDNAYGYELETGNNSIKSQLETKGFTWTKIPKPTKIGANTATSTVGEGTKWKVSYLEDYYKDGEKTCTANDNQEHTIKMFYLERGGCYSNLAMEINLPTVKPLSVIKNVDKGKYPENYYDNKYYNFCLYVLDEGTGQYVPATDRTDYEFTLKAGDRKDFDGLDATKKYKVVEQGVDPNIFSEVIINGTRHTLNSSQNVDISTGEIDLNVVNSYTFTNKMHSEDIPLKINKKWINSEGVDVTSSHSDYNVKFKIYRKDTTNGEVTPVAINGKRTFALSKNTNWNWDSETIIPDSPVKFPTRIGDRIYTYNIVEQNIPTGYKASYTYAGGGNVTITNTDTSKTDIFVKKVWENKPDDTPVKLTLKRRKVGYDESKQTDLLIKLLDEKGYLIRDVYRNDVYAGGSVEFTLDLPDGVAIFRDQNNEYPKVETGDAKVDFSGNFFEVSNLSAKPDGSSGNANVVEIKLTSGNVRDGLLLLHHSFTNDTSGWISNAGHIVTLSGTNPYAKGNDLLIKDRTAAWQGAKLVLDPDVFKPNKTYTFSTYVYYDDRWLGEGKDPERNPDSITFAMTYNDGLENGNDSFHQISAVSVDRGSNNNGWIQLQGSVTFPANVNPYGMFIIVETRNPAGWQEGDAFGGPFSFRMDEFVAVEGINPISVSQGDGKVTVGADNSQNGQVYEINFTNGYNGLASDPLYGELNGSGWSLRKGNDNSTVTAGPTNDSGAILISNRQNSGDGIQLDTTNYLVAGRKYKFDIYTQRHGADGADSVILTLHERVNNKAQYRWIKNISLVGGDHDWHHDSADITISLNADGKTIYFETQSGSKPFRVRGVRITDITGATESKPGYNIVNGQYVMDYTNYNVNIDVDSITNPLHMQGTYTDDTDWNNLNHSITLPRDSNVEGESMMYHWGKSMLEEENGFLYQYYVEETEIYPDGLGNPIEIIQNMDASSQPTYDGGHDSDDSYIATYSNYDVATNTQETPILVTNEYIWYKLPATGGSGTGRIYFLGCMFTAIGIISGSALYRRKRRRV
ncbi:carbohydrate binding domain-containing protein [Ruminococcus sp.]|uniref:carbohydrate binding domain-containing protein n=1 Tax=Ruminococcus sp. TaxID=41978 RepID=UPI0025FA57D6|nr:carbohydrate binding domain-containing protein [Ruminococcus sp.]MCR4638792.1 carbohydrate binding domain-containing protein [Ruminococcus sp.]